MYDFCCSLIDKTDYATEEWIERVIILGPPAGLKTAKLTSKSKLSVICSVDR